MYAKKLLTALLTVAMILSAFVFTTSAAGTLGDVNNDGRINIADYSLVKRHVLKTYTLSETQIAAADVNSDSRINIADYSLIKRHVLGTYIIGSGAVEKTAVEKIVAKIGNKDKISIDYTGNIAGFNGDATISFKLIGGVLNLHGHAVTKEGLEIDMLIPMPKVAENYTFTGDAMMKIGTQTITGKADGEMNAASYSIDESKFTKLTLTSSVELSSMEERTLKTTCKEAMDRFLYQANKLLEQENVGVTIADLGFTQFYSEIQEGLLDL